MRADRLLEVPERYRDGLERYALDHVEPGHFLRLVLEDWKLAEAVARMDRDVTIEELRALVSFIHNELMPGTCHGSPKKVEAWLALREHHGLIGDSVCREHLGTGGVWYESQPAAAGKDA